MRYKLLNQADIATYALVLDRGDEVMKVLETFVNEHSLSAARFTAIGAFSKVTLGYFDVDKKEYEHIQVDEQVEVLSLLGDVSLYGDKSKVHAHVVIGKRDGNAMGGHLISADVNPTIELILEETPSYLQRRMDKQTGIPLISID